MSDTTVGRPTGSQNTIPKDVAKVRDIIARRAAGETFGAIGAVHAMSRMGAKLLHDRWQGKELPLYNEAE